MACVNQKIAVEIKFFTSLKIQLLKVPGPELITLDFVACFCKKNFEQKISCLAEEKKLI